MSEFSTPPRKFWAKSVIQFGLTTVLLGTSIISMAQTLEAMPEFDAGDKWTYRMQNKGDRKEPYVFTQQAFKSGGGSGWMYFESKNPEATRKQGIQRFDYKRGDVKESFVFDPSKLDFKGNRFFNGQPSDDIFQLPLTVGKKYAVKWDWGDGNGFDDYKVEVEAFEKVKTEAGEFEAYRVNMTGYWNRTKDGQGSGKIGRTHWYAPAVKQVVKTETFSRNSRGSPWNEFTSELIKWDPKAPLDAALTPAAAKPAATVSAPVAAASQ
jgi:hypothetical protein